MKYLLEGINCKTCIEDLQAHKSQVKGLLKIRKVNDSIILETEDNVDGREILNKIIEHLEHIGHDHEGLKIYENKTIYLQGLTCANCTLKIEEATRNLPGVKDASFDFATEKYTLVYDEDYNFNKIYNDIEKIVDTTEPGVIVSMNKGEDEKEEEEGFSKAKVAKFICVFAVLLLMHFADFSKSITLIIYILAFIPVGKDVLLTAFRNIRKGDFLDENFLMSLAAIGAFIVGQYPEAVAVMLLYKIGEMFEDMALERSRKSISETLSLKPQFANAYRNNELIKLTPEEIEVGEIIVIKPGEKVPLDGIIVEGESFVNTANVTGESVPRKLSIGDKILSGYVNTSGALKVKVTSSYDDGTIAKILDLVENAGARKAPVEKFITKFAKIYTPIVVGLAVFMVVVLPLFGVLTFNDALFRACTFLVISCPCALVISVPLGVFSGIGLASKNGVFVKGGNYLEGLSFVSDVVFDKTGTITKGVFEVVKIIPEDNYSESDILKYAAMGEYNSNHPIGRAVLNKYNSDIDISKINNFEEISGHGIIYETENSKILIGNDKLLKKYNIDFKEKENLVATKVFIAKDNKFIGEIFVADVLKDNIKNDLKKLKNKKLKLTMLSGDDIKTAEKIASEVGIDRVYGNLLPEDKVSKIEDIIKNSKDKVVFVGDGVNDAPVLARADIGIAMGAIGSDSAIEAADVVLMTDDIGKISDAIDIADYTKKIVWENIVFALGIKIFVLILGAIGYASMWAAVFADVGVTLLAILNSIRILKLKINK